MRDIASLGVCGLRAALDRREIGAREAAEMYLAAIRERDGTLGAYLTVTEERALSEAAAFDRGERTGALAGIPCAVKDNICTCGVRTTCASRFLEGFVPPYSATAFERLGAGVLLGKTNLEEFAMGSSTENSAFHPTRNPADPERVPGGSSGGSAAAVTAGLCAYALGSDTGGSIRQPAALCGCVGMKPTYGRVSRYGLVAFAPSLDQIGPLTRSVRDNGAVLSALAGHDPRDATSLCLPGEDFTAGIESGVRGLRVGLITGECAPTVRDAVLRAGRTLEALGARAVETSFPPTEEALAAYYVIAAAEASSNLARFDGIRYGRRAADCETPEEVFVRSRTEGFGPEVQRRILLGTLLLSGENRERYYFRARQVRARVVRTFDGLLGQYDLLISPVSPTTAWRLGEKADPVRMYRSDIHTAPVSLAGLPALSLPFGRDENGLPCAVQLIGPGCAERLIYRAAYALEEGRA